MPRAGSTSYGHSARLLIASAAALSFTHRSAQRRAYSSPIVFPSIFAAVAVGVLAWDHFNRLHEVSVWLSVATLAAVIVRMGISFRENVGLMAALHGDALTDSLTELGNRRKLIDDLEAALSSRAGTPSGTATSSPSTTWTASSPTTTATATQRATVLLRRLGANLSAAVEPGGHAYRLGGDEFCILVHSHGRRIGTIVEAGRPRSPTGRGISISASAGAILLSAEATAASDALRLADRRMYEEKSRRTGRLERQTHELLVSIMREREPELTDIKTTSRAWRSRSAASSASTRRTWTSSDAPPSSTTSARSPSPRRSCASRHPERDRVGADAQAHPGGERILGTSQSLAPVARLVRSSHERWDGEGYPEGLSGEAIPLGARIIPICDAFAAMRHERPYSDRRDQRPPSPRSAAARAPSSTPSWSRSSAPW